MDKIPIPIDLGCKAIKSIMLIQNIYRFRKESISKLNKKTALIYSTVISLVKNLENNHKNTVISTADFHEYMKQVESILEIYRKIPNLLTLSSYNFTTFTQYAYQLAFVEYKVVELVKKCGLSCCYDILKILIDPNWDVGVLNICQNYSKLLNFYNVMFVPKSVKITECSKSSNPPQLPDAKPYKNYTESLLMKLHGAELSIPICGKCLLITGYFMQDPLNLAREIFSDKIEHLKNHVSESMTDEFKNNYISQISLRDFASYKSGGLVKMMQDDHEKLLEYNKRSSFLDIYVKSSIELKLKIITLLIIGNSDNVLILKELPLLLPFLHWSVQKLFISRNKTISTSTSTSTSASTSTSTSSAIPTSVSGATSTSTSTSISTFTSSAQNDETLPYDVRIANMKCSESIRRKANDKLREINNSKENDKAVKWLDALLRIPFGIYKKEKMLRSLTEFKQQIKLFCEHRKEEVSVNTAMDVDKILQKLSEEESDSSEISDFRARWNEYKSQRNEYIRQTSAKLDCIYGQKDAKHAVRQLIGQWINGEMEGAVFGFQGPPGTGKTTLAKEGLAQCLLDDDGTARPFAFIALGGSTNGSTLEGHGYTYAGSRWGRIVETIMESGCMNPIIYFDELDKVSATANGREIISILTHLTDPVQSDCFCDKYFDGIKIDLSKALIIFSYNDADAIDPILAERITEIRFKNLVKQEKIKIGQDFLLPKILKSVGYSSSDIVFTKEAIEHIVESYVYEAGVRQLKEKLYHIAREINIQLLNNTSSNIILPYTVSVDKVDEILQKKNKMTITKIPSQPQIGWVNGLYATMTGTGGLTVIQVFNTYSDEKFSLELTGKLGDVMKESIQCAKTISWRILPASIKQELTNEWKNSPYGLHIHFPASATPKDGPSAGAAITTAVVSFLCKAYVKNNVALTGEIDLYGNVRQIGGLHSKIEGAIAAGVEKVLIPRENWHDWEDIKSAYVHLTNFTVIAVDNIQQVLSHCIVNYDSYQFCFT